MGGPNVHIMGQKILQEDEKGVQFAQERKWEKGNIKITNSNHLNHKLHKLQSQDIEGAAVFQPQMLHHKSAANNLTARNSVTTIKCEEEN